MTHRYPKTLLALLTLFLLGFGWLGGVAPVAQANVSLLYFRVDPGATQTELSVLWETETETDTVGFRVRRSTTSNVQQATIIAQMANNGSPVSGASYNYRDSGLTPDQPYYYWLYELTSTGEDVLISIPNPGSVVPNSPATTPTPTTTLPAPTQTPTSIPTATTAPASNTPTTPPPDPTATFTVPPQATTAPVSVQQTQPNQPTSTPVVSVPTPTTEGVAPNPDLPTPDSKTGATVNAVAEGLTSTTEQVPQVPAAPTQVLDAGGAGAAASDVTPSPDTTNPTPQAIAQEATSSAAPLTERLARPTATPRPATATETSSGSGSLLLILGGASLVGAVILALAALVVWRRR